MHQTSKLLRVHRALRHARLAQLTRLFSAKDVFDVREHLVTQAAEESNDRGYRLFEELRRDRHPAVQVQEDVGFNPHTAFKSNPYYHAERYMVVSLGNVRLEKSVFFVQLLRNVVQMVHLEHPWL